MDPALKNEIATESTELATGEPPIRSRVAPDINPIGGGIVDDSQAADTSPGDGSTHTNQLSGEEMAMARAYATEHHKKSDEPHHPSLKDKVSGFGNVVAGKVTDDPAKVAYGKAKAQGEV
ncbi:hypothetical protein CcaverHIS002_0201440 [Cutaneotrichosporon cavernicola]|uniref:Uncharacterized protein n=1 Tax=Cutaneotrichosporon cavernicola TaxID=279322 RepID=A0AA48I9Q4_9TREE|nr:uncharacterized protein CcaverHIS019_0201490 [Cutaneotrichosporon cavernicola]BEI80984.1 hypothetical protein CcaverHIS002_0201440 [Cutaneotrichosporon cavernicola]BEI88787.1 hypothetical protein CcaverHIS019_0201490 [Cutaneotrichosporon cavernicola]BEI96562.1 hypothetical protein CcaverHIS631_0201510 [Cutaneotrichosporon cavernicola]BEJ04334.1 hypothetical protein CcaverHIS641_0201510 [Cutaneotrichosporon cavernicola]